VTIRRHSHLSSRACAVALIAAGIPFCTAGPAAAQTLLVQPATITFASSDPDTVPIISAPPVRVTYIVGGPAARPWTITIRAGGALISGASTIPISNVSWIATPSPPFRSGTLSTTAQTLATGAGTAALHRGDVTFRFVNSWNYIVGAYSQTITFTLSSP
jgi:hypothetical protein